MAAPRLARTWTGELPVRSAIALGQQPQASRARARQVERSDATRTLPAVEADVKPILDEVARIEDASMYSSQTQSSSAKFWRGLNLVPGAPPAGLAAVA